MALTSNKKVNVALAGLLDRQDYLVTQANDLARSLGNLSTFQHKVLDYCFSYVTANDNANTVYDLTTLEIIHHLGLNTSGDSYKRVVKAFKALNENTAIYMRTTEPDGKHGILMTSLFAYIKVIDDGRVEFKFSATVAPFVFQLKRQFYSFHLSELTRVRSKYTLAMMKLWNANAIGKWRDQNDPSSLPPAATIKGSLTDWESWFLGSDDDGKPIKWPAGRFKQKAIDVAIKELGSLYPQTMINVLRLTHGRRIEGFQIEFRPIRTVLDLNPQVIDGKP